MTSFERDDTTRRARATWARSIGELLRYVDGPQPLLRSMRPAFRRDVAAACTRSLTEIRLVLADDAATVRPRDMRRLRTFLTDGCGSPLFHDDPAQARRAARELASAFLRPARTGVAEPRPSTNHELRVPSAAWHR